MDKIIRITSTHYNDFIFDRKLINEIKDIAKKSNITVSSLSDFKNIVSNLNITDSNVEKYIGQYCFIEIGSSLSRLQSELPHIEPIKDKNGNTYDSTSLYNDGQWYFKNEHKNVIKLIFDDNQKLNNKLPKTNGFDGKTPATAVKLSAKENIYGKEGFCFYYTNGEDFTDDKAFKLKKFVDFNLSKNPNVNFVIHCMQGRSRSAAVGLYIANKIKQFTDEMLSEYDIDNDSQFNIGISKKGQPKYPHKNLMNKMGEIEGWNKENEPSKNQWYYSTLIQHPNTGYMSKKENNNDMKTENKIIKLTEEQYRKIILCEDVFISNLNNKNKKAELTYNKNNSIQNGKNRVRNVGNQNAFDMLKTDKMDHDGSDTYEVKLKGGLTSYNITSIKGTEVMHYFKRVFEHQKTNVSINGNDYELEMKLNEFNQFMQRFYTKVNYVITYCVNNFKSKNPDIEFSKVSIYPVPSSSNFNNEMAKQINGKQFAGIPETQKINSALLQKDLSNLTKDEDFIEKNKEFYDSDLTKNNSIQGSQLQYVDKELNRLNSFKNADKYIDNLNVICKKMLTLRNNRKQYKDQKQFAINMANLYTQYINSMESIVNSSKYFDTIKNKESSQYFENIAKALKYSKGPSIEGRSDEIWQMVKPYLRGQKNINGKPFVRTDINYWEKIPFQIKNMPNNTRMALKNYYNPNKDINIVQDEINKIKGTVLVIFDDNISGGATLSDICYQFKNLGIEYIIPITFGEMQKKNTLGVIPINSPEEFNY